MKVFYSDDYVAASHGFDTTRKSGRIAASLAASPFAGLQVCPPTPATREELLIAHTPAYVDCVLDGGGHPEDGMRHESSLLDWSRGLARAVCASTGGVVDAVEAALEEGVAGSLSSGLHHARADSGSGYCTFNGLVVAARLALLEGRVGHVLILDLDAHPGDGTMAIMGADPGVTIIDVSTESWGSLTAEGSCHAAVHVDDGDKYLGVIGALLDEFEPIGVDLVLYNAGMDPHEDCRIGGLAGVTTQALRRREELVFDWCRRWGLPVAFVLAGGYATGRLTKDRLGRLHRMTLRAAVRCWRDWGSAGV